MGLETSTIGRKGPGPSNLKLPGAFLIEVDFQGDGSTSANEIFSGITFGDPLIRLVNGVSLAVKYEYSVQYRATIALSTANSCAVEIGLGSAAPTVVDSDSLAVSNCPVGNGNSISISGQRYYFPDSGDSFRVKLAVEFDGGATRTECLKQARNKFVAIAVCDEVIVDKNSQFSSYEPYTVKVTKL